MMRYAVALIALFALLGAPSAQAELTIAAVGPMTGQDATMGEQLRRALDAAVAALNEKGGLLGQPVKLLYKDDACDPKQGVALANQLAGEKVVGVVGPMCSGVAIPVAKVLAEEGLVMVSPSATNPLLTEQGINTVFRVLGRDDQQGAAVGAYIAKHFGGKALAIIHDKTAYGHGLADEVQKGLAAAQLKPVIYDSINRGERDFSALISKLKQAKIEVVFYGGYHSEAGLLVRQIHDQKLPIQLIGGDGLTTSEFWSITGAAGEGTLMAFNPDPRKNPAAKDAVARIRAAGFEPEGFTMQSYAAFEVLTAAIARAGKTDGAAIAAALRTGETSTVLGKIGFDAKGDVTNPRYAMYRWSKGAYNEIEE
jgi:branched-chain amino acid transport system substrate-binding protein